jgi:hypothetical protein
LMFDGSIGYDIEFQYRYWYWVGVPTMRRRCRWKECLWDWTFLLPLMNAVIYQLLRFQWYQRYHSTRRTATATTICNERWWTSIHGWMLQ